MVIVHVQTRTAVLTATLLATALAAVQSSAEEGASVGVGGSVNTGERRVGVGTDIDADRGGVPAGANATSSEPNLRDQTRSGSAASVNVGASRGGVTGGAGVDTRAPGADVDRNVQGR
jgi:hypothetical protein